MSHDNASARLSQLEVSRAVFEKLITINDPDVVAYLDRLDKSYADEILRLVLTDKDQAQVVAMRRDALAYIRSLITTSPDKIHRIGEQMKKLATKQQTEPKDLI